MPDFDADLGKTIADSVEIRNPAALPHEAVRKEELDSALEQKAESDHTHNNLHEPATVDPANKSIALGIEEQVISAEVRLAPDSGMEITDDGLKNKFGTGENEVAPGNHVHANDHVPATADPAQSKTVEVIVSEDQKIKALVRLATDSGLKVIDYDSGDSDSGDAEEGEGLAVDFGTGANQVPRGNHTHPNATEEDAGFMSPEDKAKLNALPETVEELVKSVEDTATVNLNVDEAGKLTAQVKAGDGLKVASAIEGDNANQLSNLVLHGSPTFPLYWQLEELYDSGESGDSGDQNYEFRIYSDQAFTQLVASGERVGDGTILLLERNGSGISGSIVVAYSIDDMDDGNLINSADSLAVDFNRVAEKNHTHANATSSSDGFMSAADKQKLDALPESIPGQMTVDPGNKSIAAAIEDNTLSAEVKLAPDSGMEITDDGLKNKFGTGENEVAPGNHTHENDHVPASADPSQSKTVEVVVSEDQKIKAHVRLATDSGLKVIDYDSGDSDSGDAEEGEGLAVDFGNGANQVPRGNHTHENATSEADGFMSAEDKAKLDELTGEQTIQSVGETKTVELNVDENKKLTANVKAGAGLKEGDDDNLEVNFDEVAEKNHSHPTVTEEEAGFATPAMLEQLTDQEERLTTAEQALQTAQQDISTLGNEKADAVTVESALNQKSDKGHTHTFSEIISDSGDSDSGDPETLQEVLDSKAPLSHVGSTSTDPAIGHPAATEETAGFMEAEDKQDLECLRTLLREAQFAHTLVPMIRVESPNLGASGGGQLCPLHIEVRKIKVGGRSDQTYTVRLQLRGALENKDYTGGIVLNSGRIRKDSDSDPVVPEAGVVNVWKLILSDDGSGSPATYFINGVKTDDAPSPSMFVLEETLEVTVKGQSEISIVAESFDNLQLENDLVVPDVPPYPEVFPGHFVQIDAVKIIGECSLDDIMNPGEQGGIIIIGRDPRDGVDGQDGQDGTGTPGNDGRDGVTVINDPRFGEPPLDLIRDLSRFALMDGGEANGNIYDILVIGEEKWVAGSFTRFGNRESWGLARIDKYGKYHYAFKLENGFSEPIRHIRESHDGRIYVASVYDGMLNDTNPSVAVFKLNLDGTRDESFNAPAIIATDDEDHPDIVIGLTVLQDGKVVVLTPKTVTVLNTDGSVYCRNDAENEQLNWVLAKENQLLLSSHAFSGDENTNQSFRGEGKPRGLKLLNLASDWELDSTWALPTKAGSGAMSSCCRSLLAPNGTYFIVGNARDKFNGRNTSWNAELIGNLLIYSGDFTQWTNTTSLITEDRDDIDRPEDTEDVYWRLTDDITSEHAYTRQGAPIADGTRYVTSIYVRKLGSAPTTFPVFQVLMEGGSENVEFYTYFNPQTGAVENHSVQGGGSPDVTVENIDSNWWRLNIAISNNETGNDELGFTIFPAYSSTMGGSSTALTGYIDVVAPQVRPDGWDETYLHTEGVPIEPSNPTSNADRFRGLYKIGVDGKENLTFACNIELTEQNGHVIPFAIDAKERIYIGGPIASIDGVAVTPWQLYRLTKDGALDKIFAKLSSDESDGSGDSLGADADFDNDVLVARLNACGNIVVGGKFTAFGSRRVGRIIELTPEGEPAEDENNPVIKSATEPDVEEHPCYKEKIWQDYSEPPRLYTYNEPEERWEQINGAARLPNPVFDPVDGSIDPDEVEIVVPGAPDAAIFYTTDGTTPTDSSSLYSGPIVLQEGTTTIKCFARQIGFTDTAVVSATYVVTQKLPLPVFNPASGTATPVSVSISVPGHDLVDITIYYTTDGSDPDTGSATFDGTPIDISSDTTLKAFATRVGYRDSDIAEARYQASSYGTLPNVVFNPVAGAYGFPINVSMAVPGHPTGVTIFYTTDGSTPDFDSDVYAGPVTVNAASTVKAFAVKAGYTESAVSSVTYTQAQLAQVTFSPSPDADPKWVSRFPGVRTWLACAISETGRYMAAADSHSTAGGIYYSADYGKTWTRKLAPPMSYVAMSSDGQRLVAAPGGSNFEIYISTNAGASWTSAFIGGQGISGPFHGRGLAISDDGTRIGAMTANGLSLSTNSGGSFSLVLMGTFYGFSMSANGMKMVTRNASGQIYRSSDGGVSWSIVAGTTGYQDVVVSKDGTKIAAVKTSGGLYTTTWASWTLTQIVAAGNRSWRAVAIGNNGDTIVGTIWDKIILSSDGGSTWTLQGASAPATGLAVSNNDVRVLVGQFGTLQVWGPAFTFGDSVSLNHVTSGVDIFFTLDGSSPDETSTLYSEPVQIDAETTIKAIAMKSGYTTSDEASATYA